MNVGCIPKKLMHISTLVNEQTHLLKDYGWPEVEKKQPHNWSVLRDNIQSHIKSINFGYKSKL